MCRDVYSYDSYETRCVNARPIQNHMVNSHETAKSKSCGSLALRSQSISFKQIRCMEETVVCCLKIGPCLVSFLYNFPPLVIKTRQYRELICLNDFLWRLSLINATPTLLSMMLKLYQCPFLGTPPTTCNKVDVFSAPK